MNFEEIRSYCLSLPGSNESFPFNETALVFKVLDKMFCLVNLDAENAYFTAKCDPELAVELRERYEAVEPAYHFNKKHWNMIYLEGDASDELQQEWIKHAYDLVVAKLPKSKREELKG